MKTITVINPEGKKMELEFESGKVYIAGTSKYWDTYAWLKNARKALADGCTIIIDGIRALSCEKCGREWPCPDHKDALPSDFRA